MGLFSGKRGSHFSDNIDKRTTARERLIPYRWCYTEINDNTDVFLYQDMFATDTGRSVTDRRAKHVSVP